MLTWAFLNCGCCLATRHHVNTKYCILPVGNLIMHTDGDRPVTMQLGGYRNKLTGQVYLNAIVQTEESFLCRRFDISDKINSCTQTSTSQCNQSEQTNCEKWTQYSQITYFKGNKCLTAKRYQTADARAAHIVQQVIIIQKYCRGHNARKLFRRLRDNRRKLEIEKLSQISIHYDTGATGIHQKLVDGQFNTKKDFDLLHHQLSEWKQDQMIHMMNNVPRWDEKSRRVAVRWVIEREAQMLALIGQHKRLATKQKQQKMTDQLLSMVSKPKKWILPSKREIMVLTPTILHLQQMREIYYRLSNQPSSRLDILKQLSRALSNVDQLQETLIGQMIEEIRRLIERELEMVHSKTPIANCLGLRLRLYNLLLRYIFIVHLLEHTQDIEAKPLVEKGTINNGRCRKCGRFKQLNFKSICESCRKCEILSRADDDIYGIWLRELQKQEKELGSEFGTPAFLLKNEDIKYLVDKIWMRKSAISGVDDINQLQLSRWNINEVFSPWNCVLLTRDEVRLHQTVLDNEKNYDPVFIRKIRHRQILGLQIFSRNGNCFQLHTDISK